MKILAILLLANLLLSEFTLKHNLSLANIFSYFLQACLYFLRPASHGCSGKPERFSHPFRNIFCSYYLFKQWPCPLRADDCPGTTRLKANSHSQVLPSPWVLLGRLPQPWRNSKGLEVAYPLHFIIKASFRSNFTPHRDIYWTNVYSHAGPK